MAVASVPFSQLLSEPKAEHLPDWQGCSVPTISQLKGRFCRIEALSIDQHGHDLWQAFCIDKTNTTWDYLPYGPFADYQDFIAVLGERISNKTEPFFAIIDNNSDKAIGFVAYLRINPQAGSLEIGCVTFSPLLKRTRIATEALFLLIKVCFELGYRRCEWKCNAENVASKRAAIRLGFQFEGRFRQADVVKNYNRDTDWFSIIDKEWPTVKTRYLHWLASDNFDSQGQQLHSLSYFTQP